MNKIGKTITMIITIAIISTIAIGINRSNQMDTSEPVHVTMTKNNWKVVNDTNKPIKIKLIESKFTRKSVTTDKEIKAHDSLLVNRGRKNKKITINYNNDELYRGISFGFFTLDVFIVLFFVLTFIILVIL